MEAAGYRDPHDLKKDCANYWHAHAPKDGAPVDVVLPPGGQPSRPTTAKAIRRLLAPDGCFLDYDYFEYAGGIEAHIGGMKKVGFTNVECLWQEGAAGIVRAH